MIGCDQSGNLYSTTTEAPMIPQAERESEIERLQTEYRAVLHTPLMSDGAISPFEVGQMSKRQHEKWQRDAQTKMMVQSRIRDLRRTDADILKEEAEEEQRKKTGRIASLKNSIATWRQFGIGKRGKVKPTYQRCIDEAQAELNVLEAEPPMVDLEQIGQLEARVNGNRYWLGVREDDKPRFPGDPICCGSRWPMLINGQQIGWLFKSPAYGGRFTNSLSKLRWAGLSPKDYFNPDWHDSGPYESGKVAFNDAVRRAEAIYAWRTANAKV